MAAPYDLAGYGHPTRNAPQWYVPYLTYKRGMPHTPTASLTGGGQLYRRDNVGRFQPVIILHTSPSVSLVGGGILPRRPPFLTNLTFNPSGSNTVA